MDATLYIVKEMDAYRLGFDPVVRLWEPDGVSRQWICRVKVELPDGFEIGENYCGEPGLYCGEEHYELGTNKAGDPVIYDHKNNGAYIPIVVLSEGWDE